MNFDELEAYIPYVKYGKEKSLSMNPYPGITLLMPGRHSEVSNGGDMCVCINDDVYSNPMHPFTHTDLFIDMEKRYALGVSGTTAYAYNQIVTGAKPENQPRLKKAPDGLINCETLYYALQCLAVAEYRRYQRYESKFGGRFLAPRFSFGIAQGLWTAAIAASKEKYGRPGVAELERKLGMPQLTKELMSK